MYEPKKLEDGTYIAAFYHPTKQCWRTFLTEDFLPVEARSLSDLPKVRKYSNKDSVSRALRKYKDKL
jgi:hypothetical protein